jgi:hypothetical protein
MANTVDPPDPWRLVAEVAVGGLHSLGFIPQTDELLVVSQQGRGLIDGLTGERLARDPDDSWDWYCEDAACARGLGRHADVWVSLAGLAGQSTAITTQDGWALSLGADGRLVLDHGGASVAFSPRWSGEPVRGFAFSGSGKCLAVGVGGHTVELYARHAIEGTSRPTRS